MGEDMTKVISRLFTADSYARLVTRLPACLARFLKFDVAPQKNTQKASIAALASGQDARDQRRAQPEPFNTARTHTPAVSAEDTERKPALLVSKELAKTLQSAMTGQLTTLSGYIHAFSREKRIGFITGQDGRTYFLRRSAVIDDRLEEELTRLPFSNRPVPTHICVRFLDMGKQRADGYHAAGRVELDGND
jgi:hypothetical protein